MRRREFVRRIVYGGFVSGAVTGLSGCGTLVYRERCNQPHSDRLDWGVVALDGLALLLFFVPGVVAFVVDFRTGAIYLPLEQCTSLRGEPGTTPNFSASETETDVVVSDAVEFARIGRSREQLDPRSIERVVSEHVGRPVMLVEGDARVSELATLESVAAQRRRHDRERGFGRALASLFS